MDKKMLFVFNPKAGKGKIKANLLDIVDIFNKGGYEVISIPHRNQKMPTRKPKNTNPKWTLLYVAAETGLLMRWLPE